MICFYHFFVKGYVFFKFQSNSNITIPLLFKENNLVTKTGTKLFKNSIEFSLKDFPAKKYIGRFSEALAT